MTDLTPCSLLVPGRAVRIVISNMSAKLDHAPNQQTYAAFAFEQFGSVVHANANIIIELIADEV